MTGRRLFTERFLRFSAAGLAGFVIQVAALTVLVACGVNYLVAAALAVELAILVNFVWHEHWTWKDCIPSGAYSAYGAYGPPTARSRRSSLDFWRAKADAKAVMGRLLRYNAFTALTSIVGSVAITGLLVESLAFPAVIANIISVVTLGLVNFVGADKLVFRSGMALVALAIGVGAAEASDEAKLQPKTIAGFAKYAAAVEARRTNEITSKAPFMAFERLSAAEQARIMTSLKRGEVFVERAAAARHGTEEISVDGGSINHWRGTVFVPNVTLDTLLKVLQEPQSDRHKQEDVLSSRVVSRNGDSQKVFLRLRRTKFVTVVYDTEYDVDYKRLAPDRALSNSISTKILEIENAGTPQERALPEGDDHGYMWRLNSYWRYKQADGGVLVEVESLTLSRDLPAIIGPLIRPIVNSTARESMTRTLASVRARFMD